MLYFCSTFEEYKQVKAKLGPKTTGFVPTMGNLHEGHLTLLKESLAENELSIVSIYVNPKQFAQGEDFEDYPRTLEEDLVLIQNILDKSGEEPDVIVFAPKDDEEIYPKGFSDKVAAGKKGRILEGEIRPDHFDGVVTVVKRLLTLFKPDRAYFGKKDYQQLVLIKEMTKKEGLRTTIKGLPIVRESSGLAMSSRNGYLSDKDKEKALKLFQTLQKIQKVLEKDKDLEAAQELVKQELKNDKAFNYLSVKEADTLEEPSENSKRLVVLGNYQINNTRLLDNLEAEIK